jgi:F-type H+-transporting ATPase subunit epsilon
MSSDSFLLKVITPIGVVLEERVTQVTLPAFDGEIGILPEHVDYNSILGVGILSYNKVGESQAQRIVIAGGFCQYGDDVLTILADTVDLPETVELPKVTAQRTELTKVVDNEDTQTEKWQYAKEQLARMDAVEQLVA